MPPFIQRKCPHCQQSNQFDLGASEMVIFRGDPPVRQISPQPQTAQRRYAVTCKYCHQSFIALVKEGSDGSTQ